MPYQEIGSLMGAIDALLVPSLCVENCPLVVCDALKLGKQVISVSQPGVDELIEEIRAGRAEFLQPAKYTEKLVSIYTSLTALS